MCLIYIIDLLDVIVRPKIAPVVASLEIVRWPDPLALDFIMATELNDEAARPGGS
jgi:hypothetical protein